MNGKKAKKLRKLAAEKINEIDFQDDFRTVKVRKYIAAGQMLPSGNGQASRGEFIETTTEVPVNKFNIAKNLVKSLIKKGDIKL